MKDKEKGSRPYMILAFVLMILCTLMPVHAQIILVDLKVKIVKVERKNSRLQVRVHEGGNRDVQYIEIDSNTSFSYKNKSISYDQAWSMFKKDMLIRVKGGYTMSLHVKAKQIYW